MAISARSAQLRDQRSQFKQFSDSTRILSGGFSLASRATAIDNKNTTDELAIKTQLYNDGKIGNEEMRAFLQKLLNSTAVSERERYDIQSKIQDFDDRILVSRYEAVYKNSPDGTLQKAQAATTLANYYNSKAGTYAPGTPVQSDALEKAGQWTQVATATQEGIQKEARQLSRAKVLREIANLDPNSVDAATAKVEGYMKLANQARADGNEQEALQYETYAQNAYNSISTIQERESKKSQSAQRAQLLDYINEVETQYRRGQISPDQALTSLMQADDVAARLGDSSVQFRLTNIAQGIDRDVQRGVTYSSDGGFGDKNKGGGSDELIYDPETGQLSYGSYTAPGGSGGSRGTGQSAGKGTGQPLAPGATQSTASSGARSLSQLQSDYEEEIKKAHQWFLQGETPDGEKFGSKEYTNTLAVLSGSRTQDLQNIIGQLKGVNPDAEVVINGEKKKIRDIVKGFEKEFNDVSVEYNQLAKGEVVPVMSYGDTAGGSVKGRPIIELKPKSSIKDFNTKYTESSNGVYYPIGQDTITFGSDAERAAFQKKNPTAQVKLGADGSFTANSNKYVDVTDEAGNRIRYEFDPQYGYLPVVPEKIGKGDTVSQNLKTLRDAIIKEADDAKVSGKPIDARKPMNAAELQNFIESGDAKRIMAPSLKLKYEPTVAEQAGDAGRALQDKIKGINLGTTDEQGIYHPLAEGSALNEPIKAVSNAAQKVVGAVSQAASNFPGTTEKINGQDVYMPFKANPSQVQAQKASEQVQSIVPQMKITPQATAAVQKVQQQPVNKALSTPNVAAQSAQIKVPTKVQQPNLLDQAKKAAQGIGQKILSIFKW